MHFRGITVMVQGSCQTVIESCTNLVKSGFMEVPGSLASYFMRPHLVLSFPPKDKWKLNIVKNPKPKKFS